MRERLRSPHFPPPSSGRALPSRTRAAMESHFGHDFADVRVHDAPEETAAMLNARSWTMGRDIFATRAARDDAGVLAHELAHVVQQRGASRDPQPRVGPRGSTHERAGSHAANAIARGEPVPDPGRAPPLLQRDEPPAAAPATATATPAKAEEEPKELVSIELSLTPLNLQWPVGGSAPAPGEPDTSRAQFFSPGIGFGVPFHLWESGRWEFDLGPSLGFDFHFGETNVLPQTAGYTGTTIRGSVEAALTYNFSGGHKFSFKLAPGGGYTAFPSPEIAGPSVGVEGALEYAYEPQKGLEFFGGFRGGVDWQWAEANRGQPAEAGGFFGIGAGVAFDFPIGKKQSKKKETVQPAPTVVVKPPAATGPKTYSAAAVPRPFTAVTEADAPQYAQLRDYLKRAAAEMRAVAAAPPKHAAWMKDNPNINAMLALVDGLVTELEGRAIAVRFDLQEAQPAAGEGKTLASYVPSENTIHLPALAGATMAEVAASVMHEYVHAHQDRLVQATLSAAHGPVEHTREQELQNEIEAYTTEHYFLALLQNTSLKHAFEFGELMKISVFTSNAEKIRTGTAKEAAEGTKRIREIVEPVKKSQMERQAPARIYRLEIDAANRARLMTAADAGVDLGEIPQVPDRMTLRIEIVAAVRRAYRTELQQLFASGYKVVTLRVFQGATELEEIELSAGDVQ